ncbi:hypothetical protein FQN54_002698 [Arachnomyces sp. PD_36]|nr:hypothetical protein FQN54_002698 [Arachnomyces sp. PD_36]
MLSLSYAALAVLPALSLVAAQDCIAFEGRVAADAVAADFDKSTSAYDPAYDLGEGLAWADVLKFPKVDQSIYDVEGDTKAFEVTISDDSIFMDQTGFRRAELLPNPSDLEALTKGVKTVHFSVQADAQRGLNYSHEYMLAFQESDDYSKNQWTLTSGTFMDASNLADDEESLQIRAATNAGEPQKVLYEVPFSAGDWHNFALTLDFDSDTIEIFYSANQEELKSTGAAVSNDLSGGGKYHFGMLKKPTGEGLSDVTKEGFQESGIDEGVVFGGVFFEDGALDSCK